LAIDRQDLQENIFDQPVEICSPQQLLVELEGLDSSVQQEKNSHLFSPIAGQNGRRILPYFRIRKGR
jgi:hypothetical protein